MKIKDVLSTLKIEHMSGRTPKGRPLTDLAKEAIASTMEDEKNWGNDAIKCLNCGIILSSLLATAECINCGGIDMTVNIGNNDVA
jgi:hypothetical protein